MTKIKKPTNCQYCNLSKDSFCKVGVGSFYSGLDKHHLKPQSKGGVDQDGVIYLCKACHRKVHTVDGIYNTNKINEEITREMYKIISL